jgi:hypothetical protein
LELARKRYYGEARKRKIAKAARFTRVLVAQALDAIPEETMDESGEVQEAEYLVGWTVVPPSQMGDGHAYFQPVDAVDCASMRGRQSGVCVVRAKTNANNRVHVASLSVCCAAEGDLSVGAHMAAEKLLLPAEAFNKPEYLTITDGGRSLIGMSKTYHPDSSNMRCSRHLCGDLAIGSAAARASLPMYEKLMQIPKGHTKLADKIYEELPQDSPLRKIPKEELCPVLLEQVDGIHWKAVVMP